MDMERKSALFRGAVVKAGEVLGSLYNDEEYWFLELSFAETILDLLGLPEQCGDVEMETGRTIEDENGNLFERDWWFELYGDAIRDPNCDINRFYDVLVKAIEMLLSDDDWDGELPYEGR